MRYLRLSEVLYLHDRILKESGGRYGFRNQGGLESALALPRQTFGEIELYPSIVEKAAILCFFWSIIIHLLTETNVSHMLQWKYSLFGTEWNCSQTLMNRNK
jgi:prophage maintenance system killer protein